MMRRLLARVRADVGVEPVLPDLPDGVQARVRETASGDAYWIVLNHGPDPATVPLPTPMRDARTDAAPADAIRLDPRGVAVLTAD
jgi:beta-galactosidase